MAQSLSVLTYPDKNQHISTKFGKHPFQFLTKKHQEFLVHQLQQMKM